MKSFFRLCVFLAAPAPEPALPTDLPETRVTSSGSAGPSAIEEPPVSRVTLKVEGTCLDANGVESALVAELAGRKVVPLAVEIACRAATVDIRLENMHGKMTFSHALPDDADRAYEREVALVVAEHAAGLAPAATSDSSALERSAEAVDGRAESRDPKPAEDSTQSEVEDERNQESEVEPPSLEMSASDLAALQRSDSRGPVRDLVAWELVAGPIVRHHFSSAILVGGALQLDYRYALVGFELALADDASKSAQDIGGFIGVAVPQVEARRFRGNLGMKLRAGSSRFQSSQAAYLGGSAFVRTEVEFTRTFIARVQVDLGRGGFSSDRLLRHIQATYVQWTLAVGLSARRTERP